MIGPNDLDAIPLVDLKAAHAEVADRICRGIDDVVVRANFIGGQQRLSQLVGVNDAE